MFIVCSENAIRSGVEISIEDYKRSSIRGYLEEYFRMSTAVAVSLPYLIPFAHVLNLIVVVFCITISILRYCSHYMAFRFWYPYPLTDSNY